MRQWNAHSTIFRVDNASCKLTNREVKIEDSSCRSIRFFFFFKSLPKLTSLYWASRKEKCVSRSKLLFSLPWLSTLFFSLTCLSFVAFEKALSVYMTSDTSRYLPPASFPAHIKLQQMIVWPERFKIRWCPVGVSARLPPISVTWMSPYLTA